jgi:ABC-2 type transport system ATP-binding protein
MSNELAVEVIGLKKSYGKVKVLEGIDLRVPRGTMFALLGPNGAGKTTMVRILATLVSPDGGQAQVAGFDVVRERHKVRRNISLTGQYAAVDELHTGAENLSMMGQLSGLSRAQARSRSTELLTRFDLTDAGRRRVSTYSGGMRRRLDLAASLVVPRSVMFLDEPTTGLDLPSRQTMWQVIKELTASGVTVFLTTQYLEEADQLADQICVVNNGRVVAEGTPAELKEGVSGQRLDLEFSERTAFERATRLFGARLIRSDLPSLTLEVATDGGAAQIRALLDEVDPQRRDVLRFSTHTAALDDVFLVLTGHAPHMEPANV